MMGDISIELREQLKLSNSIEMGKVLAANKKLMEENEVLKKKLDRINKEIKNMGLDLRHDWVSY